MPHRYPIAVTLTTTLALLLVGCQRQSKLEREIIAAALENKPVHVDRINRQQLDAVVAQCEGDVVLVVYWATSSGISMQQFPHAVALSSVYGSAGLKVITVSMDNPNDRQRIIDYLKASGAASDPQLANYISMYGGAEIAYQEFEIPGSILPFFQVFDRAGRLAHTYNNSSTDIDRDVEVLLAVDPDMEPREPAEEEQPEEGTREPLFEPRLFYDDLYRDGDDKSQPSYP